MINPHSPQLAKLRLLLHLPIVGCEHLGLSLIQGSPNSSKDWVE